MRAFFNGRVWPEGFVFPACDTCQAKTAKDELLAAMVARVGKIKTTAEESERNLELIRGVHNNFPGLLGEMTQSATDKRKWLREQGFELPAGQTTDDFGLFSVTDERIQGAMKQFARKLFCALFYRHTTTILPRAGGIAFRWFTNATFDQIPGVLATIAPEFANPIRANTSLGEQFFYKFGVADTRRAAIFIAFFNGSIAMMGFVFVDPTNVDASVGAALLSPF